MYRVGIDARLYQKTGVGVYLRNLLYHLAHLDTSDIEFYIYLLPEDFDRVDLPSKKFIKRRAASKWHTVKEQFLLPIVLYSDNLDLMHFTYFSYPIVYKRPFVATVHDVTPLTFKTGKASSKSPFFYRIKHLAYQKVIRTQVMNAKTIITPSMFVKEQIILHYGEELKDKIIPLYEGVDHELSTIRGKSAKKPKNVKLGKKFFMYVGNFYPHKNVERLISAFSQLREDVMLILVGPEDFFSKKLPSSDSRISFYHNPSVVDLAYFYSHAEALLHPSLSEGFGLTLLEASHFQLPVIASNTEVVREILGEHFYPFDPLDTESIRKAIEGFLKEKKHMNASSFVAKYSFRKMAEETLRIYRKHLH